MGISLGLVGLGGFGSEFAPLFASHPLVDRIGLCDLVPERINQNAAHPAVKRKFNQRDAYATLDDILKSDLDALVIITQPWLHAPQAIAAMEHGKHVYSAVPLISLPDPDEILDWCDKLIRTCKKTGMQYMLGETGYFRAETMYARKMAAQGFFGRFVSSDAFYYHDYDAPGCPLWKVQRDRLATPAGKEWQRLYKNYTKKGFRNFPFNYPTHSLIGPMSVMNAHMVKVNAYGFKTKSRNEYPRDLVYSDETALFSMSNGATSCVREYREIAEPEQTESFCIFGNRGSYVYGSWIQGGATGIEPGRKKTKHIRQTLTDDAMRDPLPKDVFRAFSKLDIGGGVYGGHGGSHAYLVHEFVDSVAHNRMPAVNAWLAASMMAAGCAAHKSVLKNGATVNVPDWGNPPRDVLR